MKVWFVSYPDYLSDFKNKTPLSLTNIMGSLTLEPSEALKVLNEKENSEDTNLSLVCIDILENNILDILNSLLQKTSAKITSYVFVESFSIKRDANLD